MAFPKTRARLSNRIVKEGIHELGHTFGLIHCAALRCVMKTSTYVEEIDQKPAAYLQDSCEKQVLRWRNEKNSY